MTSLKNDNNAYVIFIQLQDQEKLGKNWKKLGTTGQHLPTLCCILKHPLLVYLVLRFSLCHEPNQLITLNISAYANGTEFDGVLEIEEKDWRIYWVNDVKGRRTSQGTFS